jgi:hypothetical protein
VAYTAIIFFIMINRWGFTLRAAILHLFFLICLLCGYLAVNRTTLLFRFSFAGV